MASGQYESAIKLWQRLETNYPFGNYANQAQMEIAYAYYKSGDQALALAAADRFIREHPTHPQVDYMYYLRGLISFNDQIGLISQLYKQDPTERDPKATRESFAAFKVLVERYPNSKYAADSIERMRYLTTAMARYEVHVANYYYCRGAYLASLNRAMNAVNSFQDAPAREEALYLMVRNYDQMGMKDLRDDTVRIFNANYPNSKFTNGGPARESWWKFWAKSDK